MAYALVTSMLSPVIQYFQQGTAYNLVVTVLPNRDPVFKCKRIWGPLSSQPPHYKTMVLGTLFFVRKQNLWSNAKENGCLGFKNQISPICQQAVHFIFQSTWLSSSI